MDKTETVISSIPGCYIKILHYPEDPATWIVKKLKRRLFGKKEILTRWFSRKDQAVKFAEDLKRDYEHSRKHS